MTGDGVMTIKDQQDDDDEGEGIDTVLNLILPYQITLRKFPLLMPSHFPYDRSSMSLLTPVHVVLLPLEVLQVLDPLEEGHGHTPSGCVDVCVDKRNGFEYYIKSETKRGHLHRDEKGLSYK